MAKAVVLWLLFGALANLSSILAAKTVRVALRKDTSMQGGHLGQPATTYFARAEFGTPSKPFNMLIDVNAREVWIPHHLKMGLVYSRLNYRNGYRKQDSSTSIKEQDVYKIDYAGCELSGKAYRDLFSFKDVIDSVQPVRYEQRFLAMSSASNDGFTKHHSSVDGVLGFSPWPISETGSDLVCVAMGRAGLADELKFGLLLDSDSNNSYGGELIIGGLSTLKTNSNPKYHRVVSQHSWEIGLQRVMLGANSIDACQSTSSDSKPCKALLTTTSNEIVGPEAVIKTLLKWLGFEDAETNFKFSSLYEIDCIKVATAPPLTFVIDGAYYTVPPTSYIKQKIDGLIFKSTTCYVALLPNVSPDMWSLGTNFLSNYYAAFDLQKGVVALEQKR